jgi:sodium/proline symporter
MGVVAGGLSWGLGYPGQPHILVRFMALRDPGRMRRAAAIGITWVVLAMAGAVFVGLVGRALLADLADADHVMPALAASLMHPALAGLMIAGAVAAMMSTVDSQLLVAASAVEQDIYIRLLGGKPRDRKAVWIGRAVVLGLGAVALPIAWNRDSVFDTVFNAWGVLAAGLGPVVVLGLLTRRTNAAGAVVGICAGLVVAQFWDWVKPVFGGDRFFGNGLIPGFVLNLVLAYGLSLLTGGARRPPSETKP